MHDTLQDWSKGRVGSDNFDQGSFDSNVFYFKKRENKPPLIQIPALSPDGDEPHIRQKPFIDGLPNYGIEVLVNPASGPYGKFSVVDVRDPAKQQIIELTPEPYTTTNPGGTFKTPLGTMVFEGFPTDEFVFNESGVDVNFRVESADNANAIFVDAALNRVGILNGSPGVTFDVTGTVKGSVEVQTPLVDSGGAVDLVLERNNVTRLTVGDTVITGAVTFSSAGAGANSERYGAGATAAGAFAIAIGANAAAGNTHGIAIGYGAAADSNYSIAIGVSATPSAANQVHVGSTDHAISDIEINPGGDALATYYHTKDAAGDDNAGGETGLSGGRGRGSGAGGAVVIYTSIPGAAGSTQRTRVERMRFKGDAQPEVVINDTGVDQDTRVESDNETHALFVDASADAVGLFTSSPDASSVHVAKNLHHTAGGRKVPVTKSTMTGNVVLVATDNEYQFHDPNGSDRNITLPTAATGMSFTFYHIGGANFINILDAAAVEVVDIITGEWTKVVYDGTTWRSFTGVS